MDANRFPLDPYFAARFPTVLLQQREMAPIHVRRLALKKQHTFLILAIGTYFIQIGDFHCLLRHIRQSVDDMME